MTNMASVLVLGGRSDIGLAIAHRFAKAGHPIVLAARNAETLKDQQNDIAVRYNVAVALAEFDVLKIAQMSDFVDQLDPMPQIVVSVIGAMGDQSESEQDIDAAAQVMRANYEGPALILGLFAEKLATIGAGTIVGVSSVAGGGVTTSIGAGEACGTAVPAGYTGAGVGAGADV